jgi:NTP pyrophosphatase (non-canonical NTP hydrolase)
MMNDSHDRTLDVRALQDRLRAFAAAREWERFHSPKNLVMALAGETGELLELFQWLSDEESKSLTDEDRMRAAEEVADIQIYILRLTDVLGIGLPEAVQRKLQQNEQKYPVEVSRGSATKYSRRERD